MLTVFKDKNLTPYTASDQNNKLQRQCHIFTVTFLCSTPSNKKLFEIWKQEIYYKMIYAHVRKIRENGLGDRWTYDLPDGWETKLLAEIQTRIVHTLNYSYLRTLVFRLISDSPRRVSWRLQIPDHWISYLTFDVIVGDVALLPVQRSCFG